MKTPPPPFHLLRKHNPERHNIPGRIDHLKAKAQKRTAIRYICSLTTKAVKVGMIKRNKGNHGASMTPKAYENLLDQAAFLSR